MIFSNFNVKLYIYIYILLLKGYFITREENPPKRTTREGRDNIKPPSDRRVRKHTVRQHISRRMTITRHMLKGRNTDDHNAQMSSKIKPELLEEKKKVKKKTYHSPPKRAPKNPIQFRQPHSLSQRLALNCSAEPSPHRSRELIGINRYKLI